MSMVEHARRELELIGEDVDVVDYTIGVIEKFAEFGHSGGSASIMIPRLCKLLRQEPLTPITSDPDEWEDRSKMSGYPLWQNKRDSRAFSEDGGKTWRFVKGIHDDASPEVEAKQLRYGKLSEILGERTALPPSMPDDVLDHLAALGVDVEAIGTQVVEA